MEILHRLSSTLHPSPRMPVLFVGHGNPMNAILDNDITRTWQKVGQNLPDAQAIVVISAHWMIHGTHITDAPKQPIIYDMYGFPDELYQAKYPADGSPILADDLRKAFLGYEAQLDSSWGLDHGTWSVLKHLAPKPQIPVLQISLDGDQSLAELTEMFKLLKPLRERGVIFIGSGNIVHNLRIVNFSDNTPYEWAEEFDASIVQAMSNHELKLLTDPYRIDRTAPLAIPTDEHYRPMLAAMSLLDPREELSYFNEVIDLGSVGMRSFIAG